MTNTRDEAFYAALPKVRYGSTPLVRNERGELLLVRDRGAVLWSLPGGHSKDEESPVECCARKLDEELGLSLPVGPLHVVHLMAAQPPKPRGFQFAFDCGVLSVREAERSISLPHNLESWVFVTRDEALSLLSPLLSRRVVAAYGVWASREQALPIAVGELWDR